MRAPAASGSSDEAAARRELEQWLRADDAPKTVVPDELVAHYLRSAGCATDDPAVVQLVAIAAQKFLTGVLQDAKHCEQLRAGDTKAQKAAVKKRKREGDTSGAATGADLLTVAGLKQRCVCTAA
jgi:hypothetical protein